DLGHESLRVCRSDLGLEGVPGRREAARFGYPGHVDVARVVHGDCVAATKRVTAPAAEVGNVDALRRRRHGGVEHGHKGVRVPRAAEVLLVGAGGGGQVGGGGAARDIDLPCLDGDPAAGTAGQVGGVYEGAAGGVKLRDVPRASPGGAPSRV